MSLSSLITGIAHIGIRVHDLARSRSFYEQLGFHFVVGPVGPEPVASAAMRMKLIVIPEGCVKIATGSGPTGPTTKWNPNCS